MRQVFCSMILGVVFLTGCGGSGPESASQSKSGPEALKVDSAAELKSRLKGIAENGWGGSAFTGLRDGIQKLPADKSGPLLTDLDELEKTTDAETIKSIANRMLGKL